MKRMSVGAVGLLAATVAFAQEDAEGCKDHPLFTRFPNVHIAGCDSNQFDLRAFPVGPAKDDQSTNAVEVCRAWETGARATP